jgi:predicted nucleotidyltransferase
LVNGLKAGSNGGIGTMEKQNIYIRELKDLVLAFLRGEPVKVILFGSRARGDNSPASDVDIGIIPRGMIDAAKLALLREKIEDSNIPYKVEVVDFSHTSASFKEEALKEALVWKG